MAAASPQIPHVLLLIETTRSYSRDLLRGVHRYLAEHGPWSVYMDLRALESEPPAWLRQWRGDGIITRTGSRAIADAVAAAGVPTVELRATTLGQRFPFLGVDNTAVGVMVAQHFLERGLRHFGVFDLNTEQYFQQRRDTFVATVTSAGHDCSVFQAPRRRERPADWELQQAALEGWIKQLPKPAGVLACTDQMGFYLLDACRRSSVAVPEDVAVVGVEDDEMLCTLATPPLSSVHFDGDRIGFEAAAILDRLMRGEAAPTEPAFFPPVGVVTRQSSDVIALDDADVAAALHFIRRRACDGITVDDVLSATAASRSTLERRMRALVGRTIKDEILRIQFNRVRELLEFSDLSLSDIAGRTGFRHPQYLAEAFKKRHGQTPGAYRTAHRPRRP